MTNSCWCFCRMFQSLKLKFRMPNCRKLSNTPISDQPINIHIFMRAEFKVKIPTSHFMRSQSNPPKKHKKDQFFPWKKVRNWKRKKYRCQLLSFFDTLTLSNPATPVNWLFYSQQCNNNKKGDLIEKKWRRRKCKIRWNIMCAIAPFNYHD